MIVWCEIPSMDNQLMFHIHSLVGFLTTWMTLLEVPFLGLGVQAVLPFHGMYLQSDQNMEFDGNTLWLVNDGYPQSWQSILSSFC